MSLTSTAIKTLKAKDKRYCDINNGIWSIPVENSKNGTQYEVYLSSYAENLFKELKKLSCGSDWVLPTSHYKLDQLISDTTLNHALLSINFEIPRFRIHDSRRTASTLLHEAGFRSQAYKKVLLKLCYQN